MTQMLQDFWSLTCGGWGGGHRAEKALLLHLLILTFRGRFRRRRQATARYLQQIVVRLLRGRLAVSRQHFSFPSPFDESHAVPNGLPKNLDVTVQEKT